MEERDLSLQLETRNRCMPLCGEGIDTPFHRVWECSNAEIAEATLRASGAKLVGLVVAAALGFSIASSGGSRRRRAAVSGFGRLNLRRRFIHGPNQQALGLGRLVRHAVRRARKGRQGYV